MTLRYRTPGAWGAGLGSNLSAAQVDENFYTLAQSIAAFSAPPGVGVSSVTMAGASMTIHLSDGSTQGPFVLPTAAFQFTGDYSPGTDYAVLDLFFEPNTGLYLVSLPYHAPDGSTAEGSFDPNVVDTDGNKFLQFILPSATSSAIPIAVVEESADTHSFDAADLGKYIRLAPASTSPPATVEIQLPLDPTFAIGTWASFRQTSSVQLEVVGTDTSITINTPETSKSRKQHSVITVVYVGSNVWDVSGDLEAL